MKTQSPILKIRIDERLHSELIRRSSISGRPMSTEAHRLINKGLAQEEALGPRAESGFDLMLAWAIGGSHTVMCQMLANGVPLTELIQNLQALSTDSARVLPSARLAS